MPSPPLPVGADGRIPAAWMAAAADYPAEAARAKQAGLPLTMAELQAPLPPAAQNAAPVYGQLADLFKRRATEADDAFLTEFLHDPAPSPANVARARPVVSRNGDALRLVRMAADRPRCVFSRNWKSEDPLALSYPEYSAIRRGARLLTLNALLMARDGRSMEAIREQALGFRLARHAAADNTMLAHLVGVAIDTVTLGGMKGILS